MNNTKWIYRSDYIPQETSLSLDKDILNILYNRGVTEEDAIEEFLHCSLEDIADPFEIADVEKAVERIKEAKKNHKIKRLVIDSLDSYDNNIMSFEDSEKPLSDSLWIKRVVYRLIKKA